MVFTSNAFLIPQQMQVPPAATLGKVFLSWVLSLLPDIRIS